MRKLFIVLLSLMFVFSFTVPAAAGGCGDRAYGGECFNPGFPDTGSIGTSTYPWGEIHAQDLKGPGVIDFPLGAAMVDGTGPILSTTTPNLATLDNIAKILYDSSAETTGVQWSFRVPPQYTAGNPAGIRALVSSSECGTTITLDGEWWINADGVAFDAASLAQDAYTGINIDNDTSHEEFDLSASSTVIAALTSGVWVTFELQNSAAASTAACGAADTEIAGVQFYWE